MYVLLQIIIYLNSLNSSNVTLLSNFKSITDCETKIEQTYKRYKEAGVNIMKLLDDDDITYLKIAEENEQTYTYWNCKKIIFYKNKN